MPKTYRIRTSVGNSTQSDKTIKVQVDQDFDFLEILSLKLTQSDVYRSFCSDYGVVVGRVVANGGYGVPNAKVSVFVPIDAVDQNDPVISALYPYKNVTDKNEDGYRYNLLPYTPSYEGHAATGTFPTRDDVLTRTEVLQIYEKYYKYTVKTNESGDYMIVGVPLGNQQVMLDLDLSDMGCFSLRPTDLLRMNLGNPKQFDGNQFKSSVDLSSLPQIVNQRRSISVSSFWGTGDVCDVGITRVDFDLRDSNITIEPTATFMGSIMTSNDGVMLKNNCKPSSEQGDLCGMVAGPGRILAVRQTINTNLNGDPILEQYQLEQGGKVIDENGAFVVDVPMNLDYVTTNEFGELIFSNIPSVGIPTKGKYRFKVKTNEGEKEVGAIQTSSSIIGPNLLNLSAFNPKGSLLRGNFLVPNIREYATTAAEIDKSYTWSTNWNDYPIGALNDNMIFKNLNGSFYPQDYFYRFNYNKVYSISSFLSSYGAAEQLGIQQISPKAEEDCENNSLTLPINHATKTISFGIFLAIILNTFERITYYTLIAAIQVLIIPFQALYNWRIYLRALGVTIIDYYPFREGVFDTI